MNKKRTLIITLLSLIVVAATVALAYQYNPRIHMLTQQFLFFSFANQEEPNAFRFPKPATEAERERAAKSTTPIFRQ